MITSPHKITSSTYWGGVMILSANACKILCQGSECLPSGHGKAGCISNSWNTSPLFKNPIFENINELTHKIKTKQKVV